MERIKIARQKKGISQKDLADLLGLTQQAVSYYEKGSRIPDEQTLSVISDILNVPTEYLTGETDDPEGWDLWEDATGYTPEQIKSEIQRMKTANHIVGDEENLQNLIAQAVKNLEGEGNTDRGIINSLVPKIIDLQQELSEKYEDPNKLSEFPKIGSSRMIPANKLYSQDLIYDDLNAEAYSKAVNILIQARRDLANIVNDMRLN